MRSDRVVRFDWLRSKLDWLTVDVAAVLNLKFDAVAEVFSELRVNSLNQME